MINSFKNNLKKIKMNKGEPVLLQFLRLVRGELE